MGYRKFLITPILIGLLWGCAPTLKPNEVVRFATPAEIAVIKPDSKVIVTSLKNFGYDDLYGLLKTVADKMSARNYCKEIIVKKDYQNQKDDTDYFIVVDTFMLYRKDDKRQSEYNETQVVKEKVNRDSNGNVLSGYDYIDVENFTSSTATMVAAVSLYDDMSMEPLFYFNIVSSDTERAADGKPANKEDFERKLSDQIVAKLGKSLTGGVNKIEVIVPVKGNQGARQMLINDNVKGVQELLTKSLSGILIDNEASVKEILNFYEKNKADAKIAKKEGRAFQERDIEMDLHDLYLLNMANEANNFSGPNLRGVYVNYSKILNLTKDGELVKACAHSLGRVEAKAGRVQPGLIRVEETCLLKPPEEINIKTKKELF